MVLHQVADDQIGVHQPSFGAHRIPARPRAALVAASRISPKLIFLPFLLASAPLSDRVPGCTRILAWSPSTTYSSLSPGLICSALRIFPGMVVCPFLVTVECAINCSLPLTVSLLLHCALLSRQSPLLFPRSQRPPSERTEGALGRRSFNSDTKTAIPLTP